MADYTQPAAANRRVRFFDGQYLVDQDFVDEQKYHIDRERRLGKVLRISGIVEGLAVSAPGANTIAVAGGTAIDKDGRMIVLAQERRITLTGATFNDKQGIRLLLVFRELETEMATTGSLSERRWSEDPQVVAVTTDGQSSEPIKHPNLPTVQLAQLRLDNKGLITIDASVAHYAGLQIPGAFGLGTAIPAGWRLSVNGRTRLGGTVDYGGEAVLNVAPGTISFDAAGIPGGRLVVDGTTGNVGIGIPSPGGFKLHVNGRTRIGGQDWKDEAVLSVAPGTVQFDAPNVHGGRFWIDGATGNIGIGSGKDAPRAPIDFGKSVAVGGLNDYTKAQFTLSGGGNVMWEGPNGKLSWSKRFLAISMERGPVFSDGHLSIHQPKTPIAAANVWEKTARAADARGLVLKDYEALYAVHSVGGDSVAVSGFQITKYTHAHTVPSNWILVAVVNSDDGTLKLGTGVTVAAKSTIARGNPLPVGTILMWSGSEASIPEGFKLCNGKNNTPDLRSRFIVGAGAEGTPTYAPGNSGEPDGHNHSVPMAGLNVTTSAAGSHTHLMPEPWYDRQLAGGHPASNFTGIDRGGAATDTVRTQGDGNHTHSFDVKAATVTSGSASEANNRPKWYALCFIMRVPTPDKED